jgi:tRNA dimethylallyltransferase
LPAVPPQPRLRKQLEKKSTEQLFKQLQKLDPERAKNIDCHNKRRLVRALEIILTTGAPISKLKKESPYKILKIGIKKTPEELKKLIAKRTLKQLKQGMIKEVENLHKNDLSWQRLDNLGLEYRYVSRFLRGLINKQEMIDALKKEICRYSKRQMTWFSNRDKEKRDKINWIENPKEAENLVKEFLRN